MILKILQQRYDVIIDGIFGIGLEEFGASFAKFIEYLNTKSGSDPLSVFLQVNGDWWHHGCAVFKADLTVTFGNYKTGCSLAMVSCVLVR